MDEGIQKYLIVPRSRVSRVGTYGVGVLSSFISGGWAVGEVISIAAEVGWSEMTRRTFFGEDRFR